MVDGPGRATRVPLLPGSGRAGRLAVPLRSSIPLFLCGVALHLFAVTAIGIFLGTFVRSMSQFDLVLLPLQMLSGGVTARESMPEWVQTVMLASPTTHLVRLTQSTLLRGAGPDVVWPQFLALAVLGPPSSG